MFVSIENLTKIYGTQRAIDKLNFAVEKGEILGFLGPNGAGKTTTMKIITCFMPPTTGNVRIGDFNIHEHPLEIRRKVGYLPEHNPLYLDMYVHEFLHFAGKIQQLDNRFLQKRIPEVIEMTGLQREQHKKIGMLSKGYRQRVGLSQALIHDPEVLILDEPTTGLDPNQIIEIRHLIQDIGKNKTVIFSSHILSEVEAIATRVIIINRGQIVADGTPQELANLVSKYDQIHLTLAKTHFDKTAITNIEGVVEVEKVNDLQFIIHTQREKEIRQALFQACAKQNIAMMELSKKVFTLEDTFRKLTSGK